MSVLKYILFALMLFALCVSEPLWRSPDIPPSATPVDEPVIEQKKTKEKELNR